MSRALSRSLAVVALLAVVSAALGVVTPSLAHIVGHDRSRHASAPDWLWQSHVYGGDSSPAATSTSARPHAKKSRHPYKPPVARSAGRAASTRASRPHP